VAVEALTPSGIRSAADMKQAAILDGALLDGQIDCVLDVRRRPAEVLVGMDYDIARSYTSDMNGDFISNTIIDDTPRVAIFR
jgi:hypothetical protein